MPALSNINILGQLKELLPQYVRGYLVTNVAGGAIFAVSTENIFQLSTSPKSVINLYDFRIEDFPQGSSICAERLSIYFSVAIRPMDGVGNKLDLQAGYLRAIFSSGGAKLNKFSGTFEGQPFTDLMLGDFGLFDFRLSPMRENYDINTVYYTFGVQAKVQFRNQYIIN